MDERVRERSMKLRHTREHHLMVSARTTPTNFDPDEHSIRKPRLVVQIGLQATGAASEHPVPSPSFLFHCSVTIRLSLGWEARKQSCWWPACAMTQLAFVFLGCPGAAQPDVAAANGGRVVEAGRGEQGPRRVTERTAPNHAVGSYR